MYMYIISSTELDHIMSLEVCDVKHPKSYLCFECEPFFDGLYNADIKMPKNNNTVMDIPLIVSQAKS